MGCSLCDLLWAPVEAACACNVISGTVFTVSATLSLLGLCCALLWFSATPALAQILRPTLSRQTSKLQDSRDQHQGQHQDIRLQQSFYHLSLTLIQLRAPV